MKSFTLLICAIVFSIFINAQQGIYDNAPTSNNNCKNLTVKKGETVTYYFFVVDRGNISPIFSATYTEKTTVHHPTGMYNSIADKCLQDFRSYCEPVDHTHNHDYHANQKLNCVKKHAFKHYVGFLIPQNSFNFQYNGVRIKKIFNFPQKTSVNSSNSNNEPSSSNYNTSNNNKNTSNNNSSWV